MNKIQEALKKIGRWLRDNPWAIISALLGAFTAFRILKSKDNNILNFKDAVAANAIAKRIAKDESKAEALKQKADAAQPEVEALGKKIAASKRRVVEIHKGQPLEDFSDDEIARLFKESGL